MKKFQHKEFNWKVCDDLKMIALILELQLRYKKCCFEWDKRGHVCWPSNQTTKVDAFKEKLSDLEKSSWESLMEVTSNFLGNHQWAVNENGERSHQDIIKIEKRYQSKCVS